MVCPYVILRYEPPAKYAHGMGNWDRSYGIAKEALLIPTPTQVFFLLGHDTADLDRRSETDLILTNVTFGPAMEAS